MVALRVREDARTMRHAAGLGIGRAEVEPSDARGGDGCGAHRAGFERDVKRMTRQSLALGGRAGGADRQDLGMGGRIAQLAGAVARSRHDTPGGVDQHGADRHLAPRCRLSRLVKRRVHMAFECHDVPSCPALCAFASPRFALSPAP